MDLTPDQLARAEQIKDLAISKGYPEMQADYLGKVSMVMGGHSIVWDYNIWHEGRVENAAKGPALDVEAKDIPFMCYALNRMVEVGVPVNLILNHYGEDSFGLIAAARVDEEKNVCRVAMVVAWPYDDQLQTGQVRLSAGLSGTFKDEQYTEGNEVAYWPINWAIVSADGIPAMPPGEILIAADNKVTVTYWDFAANKADGKANGKGGVEMTPEEVKALIDEATGGLRDQITALESKNNELETKLSNVEEEKNQLKEKVEAQDNAIAEPQVEAKLKDVMSRALPGKRAKIKEQVDSADGPAAKLAILTTLSLALPDKFGDYGDPEVRKELGASVTERPEEEDGGTEDEQEQRVDIALSLMEQDPDKYPSVGVALQAAIDGVKPKKAGE